jgi:hypothetical protein
MKIKRELLIPKYAIFYSAMRGELEVLRRLTLENTGSLLTLT